MSWTVIYQPVANMAVRRRVAVSVGAVLVMLATIPAFMRLGSEFMPPLDEDRCW